MTGFTSKKILSKTCQLFNCLSWRHVNQHNNTFDSDTRNNNKEVELNITVESNVLLRVKFYPIILKSFMLIVVMLGVVMLSVVMLGVIMLSAIMLSVIMLGAIMLGINLMSAL